MASTAHASPSTAAPRCVAFDLDETTGSWPLGTLHYNVWIKLGQRAEDLVRPFVRHYMAAGGARPYLRELLQELRQWRNQHRIDEVAIFTSSSNHDGWVDFLRRCMEEYAGTPGLFGRCLTREHSSRVVVRTAQGFRTMKDLSLLSSDAERVVLLDDKPEYVTNGYRLGVPEYNQTVNGADMVCWMKTELPDYAERIDAVFERDSQKHAAAAIDCSGDTTFRDCIEVLAGLFPEQGSIVP